MALVWLTGLAAAALGWWLLAKIVLLVGTGQWLLAALCSWFALVALRMAWWSLHLGVQVLLGLTNAQLAQRDFRNDISDRLFFSQTWIHEHRRKKPKP